MVFSSFSCLFSLTFVLLVHFNKKRLKPCYHDRRGIISIILMTQQSSGHALRIKYKLYDRVWPLSKLVISKSSLFHSSAEFKNCNQLSSCEFLFISNLTSEIFLSMWEIATKLKTFYKYSKSWYRSYARFVFYLIVYKVIEIRVRLDQSNKLQQYILVVKLEMLSTIILCSLCFFFHKSTRQWLHAMPSAVFWCSFNLWIGLLLAYKMLKYCIR